MSTRRPPEYDLGQMHAQIGAWMSAAEQVRDGAWDDSSAELLVPSGHDDGTTFAYLVAQTAVGAVLCGLELSSRSGGTPFRPPPGGEWIVEAVYPRREGSAVERVAAIAVATAANGEPERAIQQVQTFAHPSDRGVLRLTDLMMLLLRMYVAITTPLPDTPQEGSTDGR